MMTATEYCIIYGGTPRDIEEWDIHPVIERHICPICGFEISDMEDAHFVENNWGEVTAYHRDCYLEEYGND